MAGAGTSTRATRRVVDAPRHRNELGVSKASVSLGVATSTSYRGPVTEVTRSQKPHPLTIKKDGGDRTLPGWRPRHWSGQMSDRDLTMFCLGLYAGEGGKTESVCLVGEHEPDLPVRSFSTWLRSAFEVDESVGCVHASTSTKDLDIDAATTFWSRCTRMSRSTSSPSPIGPSLIPVGEPPNTSTDAPRCDTAARSTHRRVMAMIEAVTSPFAIPG